MPLEMWQDEDLLDRSCLGENSGGLGRGPQVAVFKFGHSEFRKRAQYTLRIQSYLLRYGDWRHCYLGLERVLGSLGIKVDRKERNGAP